MKDSSSSPSQKWRKRHYASIILVVSVAAFSAIQYEFLGAPTPFNPTLVVKMIGSNDHQSPSPASGVEQSISSTKTSRDPVLPLPMIEKKLMSVTDSGHTHLQQAQPLPRNKTPSTKNNSNQGNIGLPTLSAVKPTPTINSSSRDQSLSLKQTSSTSSGKINRTLALPVIVNQTISTKSSGHGQPQQQQELSPAGKQNSFNNGTSLIKQAKQLLPTSRQVHAAEILQRMQQRGAMDSKISSQDFVINQGFQRSWKPCVLECLFQTKPENALNIVILGGSSSARPGNTCNATTHGKPSGRYSDLLQERLDTDTNAETSQGQPQFRIINRAQGGTSSTSSALLLDSLVDPHTTDILVWEFLINDDYDSLNGGFAEQVRKLDFWLTRVKALFAHAGKPPPPILILYLWGFHARSTELFTQSASLDLNPLGYSGDLIDSYRELNWDIAVLNLAAAVNMTRVVSHPTWLLDDSHHPGCEGLKLIADMLQYALYSNLAIECPIDTAGQCSTRAAQQPGLPPHATIRGGLAPQWGRLWTDLFSEDSVVGSLSPWQPHIANATNLRVESLDHVWSWPNMTLTGKGMPGREDRKYSFQLPLCHENATLSFTLQDPNFKWLGLTSGEGLGLSINNVPIRYAPQEPPWCSNGAYINQWIFLPKHVKTANKYTISLCSSRKIRDEYYLLFLLVGVSVPNVSNVRSRLP